MDTMKTRVLKTIDVFDDDLLLRNNGEIQLALEHLIDSLRCMRADLANVSDALQTLRRKQIPAGRRGSDCGNALQGYEPAAPRVTQGAVTRQKRVRRFSNPILPHALQRRVA